jgi:hypothetical protein
MGPKTEIYLVIGPLIILVSFVVSLYQEKLKKNFFEA